MTLDNLKAKVEMIEGLKFEGTAGESYKIDIDYSKPHGEGEGTSSLELFLTSLCACMSATLAAMLRHYDKQVDELSISADGTRQIRHPRKFETIVLDVKVKSPDATREEVEKALEAADAKICPVSGMIKGNVELKYNLQFN